MNRQQQLALAEQWFVEKGWQPFRFQRQAWTAYLQKKNGIINVPTGSGKTYALIIPMLLDHLKKSQQHNSKAAGLRAIWISPIKALTKEIKASADEAAKALGVDWQVAIRTGDTTSSERSKQRRNAPQLLITTPESLHLLLASVGYEAYFDKLDVLVADEWHELVGSKRGVQLELALSRLRTLSPSLSVWGISATIGNMHEAADVLFGLSSQKKKWELIQSKIVKKVRVRTLLPDDMLKFPWAGHMGMLMVENVLKVINKSKTTLVFTNTRNQCERWFHTLLDTQSELAGWIAMHHSAVAREQKDWVEQALHDEQLKVVVCTSSLDLGVDFRPVETVIQIGSPKGVARFLQRAGRSGHQPGAESTIYFVPTHALELIEGAALRHAISKQELESRDPYIRSFDVLIQYLVTLSVSGGFVAEQIYQEIKQTYSFASISEQEWQWCLDFIRTGGEALDAYDEYKRVGIARGKYMIMNKSLATRHRLSIGTIVSDPTILVRYRNGKTIGHIEERFISNLKPGDVFMFSGRVLEVIRIKDMQVQVKASKQKQGITPSWAGGRMPFSSRLSAGIRYQMSLIHQNKLDSLELQSLKPLIEIQRKRSHIPAEDELLIEYFKDREGYHLILYPFEGRFIHEGLSTLLAWRMSQERSISFSIAVNDYALELLSDQALDIEAVMQPSLFQTDDLWAHLQQSTNSVESAKRKFRDIASIAGLVFKGFPGAMKKDRHLQSSSQLFFQVFTDYDPDNLLLQQAYEEVMQFQLEHDRLYHTLQRITQQRFVIKRPDKITPFAFPVVVSRLRERMSTESLKDRVQKMKLRIVR